MEGRSCGSCTLCCKLMGVREMDKGRGQWCPECLKGTGCRIYATRPQSCRDFACAWLEAPPGPARQALGDALRPDRCRVIFLPGETGSGLCAETDPATPTAWQRPDILAILQRTAARGQKALARAGARRWIVAPDGTFSELPPASDSVG
ncbi:hypothetical protein [Prosthecomicrobium sp. N25]|uniref:hypothetical protein n=1 Tax=Prosthecomicrobium sp. N25 TaxID=3129254 RepID=UPI0030771A40